MHTLRQKVEAKRREIRIQTRRLAKVRESNDEQHDKVTHLQIEIDRLELERKGREEEIVKFREQMKITKTNKEYAAIRVQINTLDANNRKLEDRILELMTRLDDVKAEAETIAKDFAHQTERLEKLQQELAQIEAETDPQVEDLRRRRQEATMAVPASALQTFELMAEHHDSEAMAQIFKPKAKREEFICSGCQMSIPLESVNALMNTDEVQTCHVCSRILYLDAPTATDRAATG